MTPKAQVEQRGDDPWAALEFLGQARRFLRDGQVDDLSDEGRQVLLHNAAVAACDAILAINGLEVTGSEGGHRLRFEEAHKRLGGGHHDLFNLAEDLIEPRLPEWGIER
jgi:hypothetical protein